MLSVVQKTLVVKEGSVDCNHLYFYQDGRLSFADRQRTQERICAKCGRYEAITTSLVVKEFGFGKIFDHFHAPADSE